MDDSSTLRCDLSRDLSTSSRLTDFYHKVLTSSLTSYYYDCESLTNGTRSVGTRFTICVSSSVGGLLGYSICGNDCGSIRSLLLVSVHFNLLNEFPLFSSLVSVWYRDTDVSSTRLVIRYDVTVCGVSDSSILYSSQVT